ncbi:MAG: histidinol dehydrogenase, partial [Spirochaetales bacterium]|nr:histidinol dehydrogenase [Spirochaetales bacterium]
MNIAIKIWADLSENEREKILHRSEADISSVEDLVRDIIDRVSREGDKAIREFTQEFDQVSPNNLPLLVGENEYKAAENKLDDKVLIAISEAVDNVMKYHLTQRPDGLHMVETSPGIYAGERAVPIPSAGLYVPRGKGSFPSMLYMLAIPARIAKVPRICVSTPPNSDGSVDPACLYAAKLCGVHEVYRIGGAQAIAALALGTEAIKPVDKIVGPGSPFVAAAKRLLAGEADQGLPAGPSESIVLADNSADPWKTALDLMVEAEHGDDSAALLVTDSPELANAAADSFSRILRDLPEPRKGFVEAVMNGYGGIILTSTMNEAVNLGN